MYCLICKNELNLEVISNSYHYFKCKFCGTSQVLPQPSEIELNQYYQKFHLSIDQGGSYDLIEQRMIDDFSSKVNIIKILNNNSNNKLLDVGCGKGFFVKEALSEGFDAIGIDISESGIRYAKKTLNINAELTSIEKFSKEESNQEMFDVISLWATIEHISNPLSLLTSINTCLKKDGIIILDTGLGDDKFEKLLAGHSQWYDALQHLFVYSEKGLKMLLEQSGFKVIRIDRNFERSYLRKLIRFIRHSFLCITSWILLRPVLGKTSYLAMKSESKWPIGKLIQIAARKIQ